MATNSPAEYSDHLLMLTSPPPLLPLSALEGGEDRGEVEGAKASRSGAHLILPHLRSSFRYPQRAKRGSNTLLHAIEAKWARLD
jgi:hypothetical protein